MAKVTGFGELTLPDGSVFKGAFLKGMPHGFGEKHWPAGDGKVYKGKKIIITISVNARIKIQT